MQVYCKTDDVNYDDILKNIWCIRWAGSVHKEDDFKSDIMDFINDVDCICVHDKQDEIVIMCRSFTSCTIFFKNRDTIYKFLEYHGFVEKKE